MVSRLQFAETVDFHSQQFFGCMLRNLNTGLEEKEIWNAKPIFMQYNNGTSIKTGL
jgi:hypothetical protein